MDPRRLRSRSAISSTDGPGGLLGMALDPGLLKGTGNDYVYVAYTYDADADPATVTRRTKIVRFTYDPRARTCSAAPGTSWPACPPAPITKAGASSSVPIGSCISRSATWAPTSWPTSASRIAPKACRPPAQLQARDWSLYEGKMLRLNLDGSIPPDNPTIAGVKKPHLLVRPSQSSGAGLRAGREVVRVRARAEHGR